MRKLLLSTALAALLAGAGTFALAEPAGATHVVVEVAAPQRLEVGQAGPLEVSLLSAEDGQALVGAPVTVSMDASFSDVAGEVELGRAVTDEHGTAVLPFEPRIAGEHTLRIEYLAPGEREAEVTTAAISVAGAAQVHRSASGVQIPGLNVWLIMAVVASVWAILFSVGVRVVFIARAGGAALEAAAAVPEGGARMSAQGVGASEG